MIGTINKRDKAILIAVDLLYLPYIWAEQNPDLGFDCSGFCTYIGWETGILPQGKDLWAQKWYRRLKDNLKLDIGRGDFLFYGKNKGSITHMMMAINDKVCIGAVGGNRYTTTPKRASRRKPPARIDIRTVRYRHDLVAICDPFGCGC